MKPEKILYTARATSTAGRQGLTRTEEGMVVHALALPVEMGGSGKGANPEQLFAAGYAACFGSAVEFFARKASVKIGEVRIKSEVGIGPAGEGFALAVKLKAHIEGIDLDAARRLVEQAHQVCPYSNATRNNIDVELSVE